jgi:hypothetical protein
VRRRKPTRRKARRSSRAPSAEELRLLGLARELTALAHSGRPAIEVLGEALGCISAGAVPRRRPLDKARRLALAWAREQARLALTEMLERAARSGSARHDVGASTLAWLMLAAGEALAREPAEAAADRVQAIVDFLRAPVPRR